MTEWVTLGTEEMEAAQAATGLSHERLARKLPISEKTWRRWVARGQVPRHELPKVAKILGLEIEVPERRLLSVEDSEPTTTELSEEIHDLGQALEDQRQALGRVSKTQTKILEAQEKILQALAAPPRTKRKRG